MNTIEFLKKGLENRHIEFSYEDKHLTGIILDIIPPKEKKSKTHYVYIPSKNLIAWRKAEAENNLTELKKLSKNIDILDINWGEELPMDKKAVEMRIVDWKNRIKELYDNLHDWIKEDYRYQIQKRVDQTMYEEMMQKFGVQPQKLSSADIYKNSKLIMTFKPAGLWLIGANGRIDIISNKGALILVDLSDKYRTSDWNIYLGHNIKSKKQFNKSTFLKLISE